MQKMKISPSISYRHCLHLQLCHFSGKRMNDAQSRREEAGQPRLTAITFLASFVLSAVITPFLTVRWSCPSPLSR